MVLHACAIDGAGHPKPEYDYRAKPNDPEFFLESDFGMRTEFKAKIHTVHGEDGCLDTQRVAFMQKMDSYLRRADLPGPWKIAAPANEPVLIAGQWAQFATSSYNSWTRERLVTLPASCPWKAKIMTPLPGAKYKVRLSSAGALACELSISLLDGTPVETRDAPSCAQPRR